MVFNILMKLVLTLLTFLFLSNISYAYDEKKYLICYGEMTKAHKARGFHQSNRSASITVKETVCEAYAKGEINSYEGKGS